MDNSNRIVPITGCWFVFIFGLGFIRTPEIAGSPRTFWCTT